MRLALNIYTDDTLTEVKRTAEADKLKIPYRVAMYIVSSLDRVDINNENDILKLITSGTEQVDKIIKATFAVTDTELECVDASELVNVAIELYKWALEKFTSLKGSNAKNAVTAE